MPPYARLAWPALVVLCLASKAATAQDDATLVGQWSAVKDLPLVGIHAHMLPNGRVMFYGRISTPTFWDPATEAVTTGTPASYDLFCSGHALTADGRLFIAGGHVTSSVGLAHASTYDAPTDTWTRLPDMNAGRWYPTSTTLANGDVLVVSGNIDTTTGRNRLPQVWQAATNTWRDLAGAQLLQPNYPSMFLAPNGKVFNAGPTRSTRYLDTAGTGAWTFVANTVFGDRGTSASAGVMYAPGKVLILGGADPPTNMAEVIDLNDPAPAWRSVQPMAFARRHVNATLLPDGTVLVTGGTSSAGNDALGAVLAAELWDPATEGWTTLASMKVPRLYHSTALLLPDGRVLSVGGGQPAPSNGVDNFNYEIYSPPYLFKGSRPAIQSAPASVSHGETFFVGTGEAAQVTRVTWVRLSSVTHSFNQNQRFNQLSFTQAAGGLSVTAPSDPNLCPPGHYMLFILDGRGVPSVARIVRVEATSLPPDAAPAAPSDLTAAATSSSQINLGWVDASENETGFRIERSPTQEDGTWAEVASVGADVTSYSNTSLAAGTTYFYRVKAFNGVGESPYSNTASATTPSPPPNTTSTTLVSSANPSVYGQAVTFTATVNSGAGVPTGSVRFYDGTTSLGTVTLSNGSASLTRSNLAVRSHSMTAAYVGTTAFPGSTSPPVDQQVTAASTATSLASSLSTSTYGQAVTFTATVSVVAPGGGTPTGTVRFFDGATSIGSASLSGGVAQLTKSNLTAGNHPITATYVGKTNYTASTSAAVELGVSAASTNATLASSVTPSVYGQPVTFTATVSALPPGAGTPTGAVGFYDGGTLLASVNLSGGVARLTRSTLAAGTSHPITAQYVGSTNYLPSTSPAVEQSVTMAATTTTLSSSLNPSGFGQSVTFVAVVTAVAPGGGTVTGTVKFYDGATLIGTKTLSGGKAQLAMSNLTRGSHTIRAEYAGTSNYQPSNSADLVQQVN